eukprot:Skav235931  [mRNA]  locus=scaffold2360:10908:18340:+ [translate_table: standard]
MTGQTAMYWVDLLVLTMVATSALWKGSKHGFLSRLNRLFVQGTTGAPAGALSKATGTGWVTVEADPQDSSDMEATFLPFRLVLPSRAECEVKQHVFARQKPSCQLSELAYLSQAAALAAIPDDLVIDLTTEAAEAVQELITAQCALAISKSLPSHFWTQLAGASIRTADFSQCFKEQGEGSEDLLEVLSRCESLEELSLRSCQQIPGPAWAKVSSKLMFEAPHLSPRPSSVSENDSQVLRRPWRRCRRPAAGSHAMRSPGSGVLLPLRADPRVGLAAAPGRLLAEVPLVPWHPRGSASASARPRRLGWCYCAL